MRVLVTGGNGFVGAAIINKLLEEEFEVWALLNENSELNGDSQIKDQRRILRADIRYPISLENTPANLKFDAVIHTAGLAHQFGKRAEKDFWDGNVAGTKNVAEAAAKLSVKQFILISSVAVYGNSSHKKNSNDKGLDETAECAPEGIYAVTKFASEKVARTVCQQNDLNLTVLRLATVIGENDCGNVFRLIKAVEKKRFLWIGKGQNRKSLIYKADVARACAEVLKHPEGSGIYNLSADSTTMKEIVSEIYAALNRKNPKFYIPANLLLKFLRNAYRITKLERFERLVATVEKWLSDEVFSGEKFQRQFNFKLSVPVREAVRREVENYLQLK